ncbi:MAG: anthranilate synthase component I, partial [Thermosynechococcaceae cyanobacterium]
MLPWYWRSLPLAGQSGASVFAALFQSQPIAVLLESPPVTDFVLVPNSRFSICAGAPRSHQGRSRSWTPHLGTILDCLAQRLQEADLISPSDSMLSHLPFTGGWLGW